MGSVRTMVTIAAPIAIEISPTPPMSCAAEGRAVTTISASSDPRNVAPSADTISARYGGRNRAAKLGVSVTAGSPPSGVGVDLVSRRVGLDEVPLELELVVGEPCGGPDELGEVEDRHAQLHGGLPGGLALPGVEREVAERARRHHRVRPRLLGLRQRLDQLAQRHLLAGEDDREPAALDLRRVVHRLGSARFDDALERLRPVGVLEAEQARGAQDLAAVERRDLDAAKRLVGDLLEPLVALALRDLPQQVAHVDA